MKTNNYFVTGSCAMTHIMYDLPYKPKDLDIFYIEGQAEPKLSAALKIDYHAIPKELFNKFVVIGIDGVYLDLESQYVLKLSHIEYPIHFDKNIQHLQLIKKHLKAKYNTEHPYDVLPEKYHILFQELVKYWKIIHKDKKNFTLNMPKDKFFNKNVKRKYDHDFIHSLVSYYEEPMYKKCLKKNKEVLIDEKKFNILSFEDKLKLCREEIYVLALERFLIPNDFKLCIHETYRKSLKKLVTTMSKGFFPTFICNNYDVLYKQDIDYVEKFKKGLKK